MFGGDSLLGCFVQNEISKLFCLLLHCPVCVHACKLVRRSILVVFVPEVGSEEGICGTIDTNTF